MPTNLWEDILQRLHLKQKIGLALGGGVVRAVAHIGVLKVIKKKKLKIDCVAACSAGSIIGALYAAGLDPLHMEDIALNKLNWFKFVKPAFWKEAASHLDEIKNFIKTYIGDVEFKDLDRPFAVVTQDMRTGAQVILKDGKVSEAVAASCAFPGIFIPVRKGKHLLMDGGIVNNLPVSVLQSLGATRKIAVDVVPHPPFAHDPGNPIHMFERALDMALHKCCEESRKLADVLIVPQIPEDIWHMEMDKGKLKRLIEVGEQAAEKKLA